MSRKYFGTDGIRGRVGESPMTPEFALRLGWAAGRVLGQASGSRVLIGKDTRRSGYLFESALEAGLAAAGVETHLLGPMPTPGVAHLTRVLHAQAGIVVSASHNPHHDNGIKFFSADGSKLDDATEMAIETMLDSEMQCVAPERIGHVRRVNDAAGRYIEFCKSTFGEGGLDGLHLVVDCANGAAYRIAPAVFTELGARVDVIADQPDGLNINRDCGSTHLDALSERVRSCRAHLGIALDGDADRCLMVDACGEPVDGDQLLYVIARMRQQQGTLGAQVVGTQMSNLGLEHALRDIGVALARAQVGDRHVLEMLKAQGATLGGETSGHLICLDRTTTGDGIVGALQVLRAIVDSGRNLAELVADVVRLPQCLVNVRVGGNARAILQLPDVRAALAAAEASLGERGRILLRASGTEPLVRVMVEAPDVAETRQIAESLAESVRSAHESTKEKVQ